MADPSLFKRTARTEAAVRCLSEAEPGQIVTYKKLSAAAGLNVQKPQGRRCVYYARQILWRAGMVFRAVTNVGLQRLTAEEVATLVGDERRRKVRNQTRYCLKEFEAVADETEGMSREALTQYLGTRALMEVLRQESSHHAARRKAREEEQKIMAEASTTPASMSAFRET
jgi:hypothetical protein